jgi:hypothetical protein
MSKSNQENKNKPHKKIILERKKYFILMLEIKSDTNMTRIYSAISPSLLNETNNNSK